MARDYMFCIAGDKNTLFMGNHGVVMVAPTVALAFDNLYYLERAAEVQVSLG